MAEYTEVIKQFKRMCESTTGFGCTRGECPIMGRAFGCENIGQCRKIAFQKPAEFEERIMSWAAEHPEPVYPTWWKYMCMIGVIPDTLGDKTLGEVTIEHLMGTPIPADIAEKLGIKPKEGKDG